MRREKKFLWCDLNSAQSIEGRYVPFPSATPLTPSHHSTAMKEVSETFFLDFPFCSAILEKIYLFQRKKGSPCAYFPSGKPTYTKLMTCK